MMPRSKDSTTRDHLLKIAAVNYHFGTKQSLYLQVFRERWLSMAQRLLDCLEENLAGHGESSLGPVIRALAEAFIKGPFSDEERLYHFQLVTFCLSGLPLKEAEQ